MLHKLHYLLMIALLDANDNRDESSFARFVSTNRILLSFYYLHSSIFFFAVLPFLFRVDRWDERNKQQNTQRHISHQQPSSRLFIFFRVLAITFRCFERMFLLILFLFIVYGSYRLYQYLYPSPNVNPQGKYVLISGCDTGFGHTLAITLDQQGFNVLAGVYSATNQTSLEQKLSSRATVFCLDITQPAQIEDAYQLVKSKTNTLYALVNNAGIDQDGLIDWISLDFMRHMMEINFFGHVAMTKTFLPLLLTKRGSRVVNLCSVAGYLVAPSMAAYCATKYAFESFSDCLRREMYPWDLRVSIIEPSYMRTPIIEGHVQNMCKMWNRLPMEVRDRWGENYFENLAKKRLDNLFIRWAQEPIVVVRALEHAVMNTKPQIRYRPGWQSSLLFFPLSIIPAWITDFIMQVARGPNVTPAGVSKQLRD